jgi:hypothetical protein
MVNDISAAPMAESPPNSSKINVCTGQAKTSCKRREGIDANGDDEKRILTIRRDDITELGLRVGNIINIRLSTD